MKKKSTRISLGASYEDIELQLARDLGLSSSLATLRKVTANGHQRQPQNDPSTERAEIERMFAGKSLSETLPLYRANKERVRRFLGLSAPARNGGSRFVHRSYK